MSLDPVAVVGALYTAGERGLAADVLSARALGLAPMPVCTSIVVAGEGRVTDVTDVPVDTVHAQLDHLGAAGLLRGIKVGILGGPKTVEAVCDFIEAASLPTVMDIVASGPSGETVLSNQGIDAVADRLGVASMITVSRADAELITRGQIESLDDAQVAAQRIHNRGAKRVVIRCGYLPYRFYDAASDPGTEAGQMNADLYFDGQDFALFEADHLEDTHPDGAASVFAMTVLRGLIDGLGEESALQAAKRAATEAVRLQVDVEGHEPRVQPDWERFQENR